MFGKRKYFLFGGEEKRRRNWRKISFGKGKNREGKGRKYWRRRIFCWKRRKMSKIFGEGIFFFLEDIGKGGKYCSAEET